MSGKPTYEELEKGLKKLTKEALDQNKMKEEFEGILNSSIDMIGLGNLQGYFTKINSSFEKTLGYSKTEILENPFIDYVHDDDVEKTKQALADAAKGNKEIYIENRYKCKDGSHKWIEWKILSIVEENKFIAVGRDVTERKRFEEKLQESNALFQAIVESLPFDVFALNCDNRYILQNSICRKNWGDLIGKSPEDIPVNEQTKQLWLENNQRAFAGETVSDEVVYHRLNEGKNYYYNIITPIRIQEKLLGILGVLIDVSDIKQAEDALRKSEERFRNLTETTSDWVWEVDENAVYTYVNPKVFDILGYREEEIIGKKPFDLMLPADADRVLKIFNTIAESKKAFHCLENINLHKNGDPLVLETSGVPIFDDKGELCGYRGIDRDITERKRNEELLRKKTHDLKERVKELNCLYGISKIREKTEISFDEILQEIADLLPSSWQYPEITCARIIIEGKEYKTKNFKETIWKQTSNIAAYGKQIGILEICYLEEKPKSNEGPFLKQERRLIHAVAERLGRINELNMAEEELLESKEKYRLLSEGTSEAVVWHDKGKIIEANNQFYEMFGYKPEELAEKDAILLTVAPNSVKVMREQISLGNLGPYEVVGIKKDGTEFPMEVRVKMMKNKGITARMAAVRDLTTRKQAEDKLKKAHDELELRVKERTRELQIQKSNLEEANIALQVLLDKRQEDKKEISENVMTNIKEIVMPYFEKIKKTKLDDQQKALLSIIESNIKEIISPFVRKMPLKYVNLTPTEIHIANLIRHGINSKDIAETMGISPQTIYNYRKNIRKKIGLKTRETNLRSYLLSTS